MKQCYLRNISSDYAFCLWNQYWHSKIFKNGTRNYLSFETIIGTSQLATNVDMAQKEETHKKIVFFFSVFLIISIYVEKTIILFFGQDMWDLRNIQLVLHLLINFFCSYFFFFIEEHVLFFIMKSSFANRLELCGRKRGKKYDTNLDFTHFSCLLYYY